VYVRVGQSWVQWQKLTASDGSAFDAFGLAVAISGDTIVVGAPWANHSGNDDAGAAYVFTLSGTYWVQEAKLTAGADSGIEDYFGDAVAVSDDHIVVGAPNDDHAGGVDAGSAYVFVHAGVGAWSQQTKLFPVGADTPGDSYGASVALSGSALVVGAPYDNTADGSDAGSAYFYTRSGTAWPLTSVAQASDGAADDYFGGAVAPAAKIRRLRARGPPTCSCVARACGESSRSSPTPAARSTTTSGLRSPLPAAR
jgi:hypothetical protein